MTADRKAYVDRMRAIAKTLIEEMEAQDEERVAPYDREIANAFLRRIAEDERFADLFLSASALLAIAQAQGIGIAKSATELQPTKRVEENDGPFVFVSELGNC